MSNVQAQWGTFCYILRSQKTPATRMGFEPTRAEHNGLAVHRLNHSATSSGTTSTMASWNQYPCLIKVIYLPCIIAQLVSETHWILEGLDTRWTPDYCHEMAYQAVNKCRYLTPLKSFECPQICQRLTQSYAILTKCISDESIQFWWLERGSVAQWIARRTSNGCIVDIRRLWVRVPPESMACFAKMNSTAKKNDFQKFYGFCQILWWETIKVAY